MQASSLRRQRSRMMGMIVPKYDNRYFDSIVERFEKTARDRGLFPIFTCTQRDSELEVQAARAMLSYQVECIVLTGATDPDRIAEVCASAGVRTVNLDLPGSRAPSVISDNFSGSQELTRLMLRQNDDLFDIRAPLLFIGGLRSDHNTAERIRGFRTAHARAGLAVPEESVITCGYAADQAELALAALADRVEHLPESRFVNSTITLEGVMRWIKQSGHDKRRPAALGCFDWDPFAALLAENITMVRQNVPVMLDTLFDVIDADETAPRLVQIPPIIVHCQWPVARRQSGLGGH